MDKYEFNIKVEQIRKLVNKEDYETALKIADTIDWRKVRNANLLSMVAQVYEKNREYQDAKDILLLAFERAPIGKRLLFKLTDLALKEGGVEEAEAYYREFCDLAGDDPRQHLLRYMILKAKGAPTEQLIHSLESYTSEELDEKWLYELAELYHEAGMGDQCVAVCDRLMLMFGLGKYVDKAMDLKVQYAPLSRYQMDLVENREKYEAKLRAVERSFEMGEPDEDYAAPAPSAPTATAAEIPAAVGMPTFTQAQAAAEASTFTQAPAAAEAPSFTQAPAAAGALASAQAPAAAQPSSFTQASAAEAPASAQADSEPQVQRGYAHDELVAAVRQAETEENLAKELSKISTGGYEEADEAGKTRVLTDLKWMKEESPAVSEPDIEPEELFEEDEEELPKIANHVMIEARTPEKGLELARETLKQIQAETGIKNPVAKISGSKLNRRGILANKEKLAGRDLMIEEAGDLSPAMLEELEILMEQDTTGMRIVLIDNPKQMETLHAQNPTLASRFECIGTGEPTPSSEAAAWNGTAPSAAWKASAAPTAATPAVQPADERPVRMVTPARNTMMFAEENQPDQNLSYRDAAYHSEPDEIPETASADEEEMDIDEFAQYACQYASEIDCSITGKSMLALYERIEIMEEDGIPLTKATAAELIEEAADKAERPSLGKRITGVFSSKYDKDGLLILKEEHFI